MNITIGSARSDSSGKYSGDTAGDQRQDGTPDKKGEVSMQPFYIHSKGWYILRLKNTDHASKAAKRMKKACNNKHIGYDQSGRSGILSVGIDTEKNTECDCGTLVRQCIKEATGIDPGEFSTESEVKVLGKTGLFKDPISYTSSTTLYEGDVLVTKTKGHTAIVTDGNSRSGSENATTSIPSSAASTSTSTTSKKDSGYTTKDFVTDVQKIIGAGIDGIAGTETLSKTITVSRYKNRTHKIVVPIQKRLNALGYSCGTVDGIAGVKFESAVKRYQKANGCVVDGELTAKNKTWKKILGMN